MENVVEDFSSFLELLLNVKMTPYVKGIIRATIMNAYATNNFPIIQNVNNSIASLPQIQTWNETNLNYWRAQFQPQFLVQLQNSYLYDPFAKALLDLYNNEHLAPRSQQVKKSAKTKTIGRVGKHRATNHSIEGIWSNKERSAPLTSGIGGFFQSYEVYEFKNGTFRKTCSNKSVAYGDSKTVVTGYYQIEGNTIRMSSSDFGERVFLFSISNFGRSLALKGLDENSISFSGTYQREQQ